MLKNPVYARAVNVAREGTQLIQGRTGDYVRGALDVVSTSTIDNVHMPSVMINAEVDLSPQLARIAGIARTGKVRVGDSGTQFHVVLDAKDALPGSIKANTTTVSTANGVTTPKLRCDVPMQVGMKDGSVRTVIRRDALVIPNCAHELVSLGNLAKDEGVKTRIGDAHDTLLEFPDGATAPAFNLGIVVLPFADKGWHKKAAELLAVVGGAVTSGNQRKKHVPSRIVHCRGVHANPRTLNDWHKCSNAPREWHVHDEACDDCLQANSDVVHSHSHAPQPTGPGDYVSYDVYKL